MANVWMQSWRRAVLLALISSKIVASIPTVPVHGAHLEARELQDRETACIALDDCGGLTPQASSSSSSSTTQKPSTSASPSATPKSSSSAAPSASALAQINEWSALGDSFASGVGAGDPIGNMLPCRQFDQGYPPQMNGDSRLGSDTNRKFNFVACSGSRTKNIVKGGPYSQADRLGNPQIATLTIGGNNVGFFDILNACIYQFYWGWSGDCNEALANSQALIDSPEFETNITDSINDVVGEASAPNFKLYMTGYAAFFNEDTTQCNDVSFGYHWFYQPKLTQDLRKSMNTLVINLNHKLSSIISGLNNPKVKYVDYNLAFNGHRLCEAGVTEPDPRNGNTWIFELYSDDHDELLGAQNLTSVDPSTCQTSADSTDDWGDLGLCAIALANQANGTSVNTTSSGSTAVSPALARIFHPKAAGHTAIKNAILSNL